MLIIALAIVGIVIQISLVIRSISIANKNPETSANPAAVQQQTIQKAYELMMNQTLEIDNQK